MFNGFIFCSPLLQVKTQHSNLCTYMLNNELAKIFHLASHFDDITKYNILIFLIKNIS